MNLLQEIEKQKAGEALLRKEIEAFLLNNKLVIECFDLGSLSLRHQIYERPVSYINIQYGRVVLGTGKGYTNFLDEVSMDDIKTILEFATK